MSTLKIVISDSREAVDPLVARLAKLPNVELIDATKSNVVLEPQNTMMILGFGKSSLPFLKKCFNEFPNISRVFVGDVTLAIDAVNLAQIHLFLKEANSVSYQLKQIAKLLKEEDFQGPNLAEALESKTRYFDLLMEISDLKDERERLEIQRDKLFGIATRDRKKHH